MSAADDVITQVPAPGTGPGDVASIHELPETTMLNLRGRTFAVSRERLLSLPENILFGLTSGSSAYAVAPDEHETGPLDDDAPDAPGDEPVHASESAAAGASVPASEAGAAPTPVHAAAPEDPNALPPLTPDTDYESAAVNGSVDSVEEGETGLETELETMRVDFNADCFAYILEMFDNCERGVAPVPITSFKEFRELHPGEEGDLEGDELEGAGTPALLAGHPFDVPDVLSSRPAVVVLREDLEYYLLTKPGLPRPSVIALKEQAGNILANAEQNRLIFSGLRNRDTLDSPEYHLMQMLVLSGLATDQLWAFREREPRQARVLSLQLQPVQLPPDPSMIENVRALQKLLLFWRKPAKKCWWDKLPIELGTPDAPVSVTMHARRVWTLELSILGLTS